MFFRLEAMLYVSVYLALAFYFCFLRKRYFNNRLSPMTLLTISAGILMIVSIFIFDSSALKNYALQPIIDTIKNPSANIAWVSKNFIQFNQQVFIWVFLFYVFGSIFLLITCLSIFNLFTEKKGMRKIILLLSF